MKKNFIYLAMTIFLIGCGGGGSSSGESLEGETPAKGNTKMVLNQVYVVSPGDQIHKETEAATLKITHIDGNSKSTVELLEGNAILTKN